MKSKSSYKIEGRMPKMIQCLISISVLSCIITLWYIIFLISKDVGKESVLPNLKSRKTALNENQSNPTRLMNLHKFQYTIDTNCVDENGHSDQFTGQRNIRVVWIITSYAGDVSKRSALRNAYTDDELKELGIRRIFLLGTLSNKAQGATGITQQAIKNEADRFHDIIQGNFIEAYKNLTYKHLMGLNWALDKCSRDFSYIMKMDDDIIVNIYEALTLLKNKSAQNSYGDFLLGYAMEHMAPIRNKESKWFVTYEEFAENTYPSFLSGWFYILDMLTAMKLVFQSRQHAQYFWIDDLFITGILREESGVRNFIDISEYFTSDYRFLKCCLKDQETYPQYKCDFIVGPDGGDRNLLLKFQKFSKECHQHPCKFRPRHELLKDKCILDDRKIDLGSGSVQIEPVSALTIF